MLRMVLILNLLAAIICTSYADELHLLINGKAVHLQSNENLNEDNDGFGFQYDFDDRDWIPFVNASVFKDSYNETSRYAGIGSKLRFGSGKDFLHFDAGLFAFVMTRKLYKNGDPFFGVLPVVSIGGENLAINATYVPALDETYGRILYFQAMVRFSSL